MADLKIKIGVEADASGAEKVKKGLSDVEAAAQKASKSTGALKSALDGIKSDAFANLTISLRGLSSVISSATQGVREFIAAGLENNTTVENLNSRLRSLINVAEKSGKLDPFEKWKLSGQKASAALEELKKLDSELDFSSSDLAAMFTSFYSTASSNMSLEKALALFRNISYAAQSSGADVSSLKATLDSVGAGIIQTNTDFGRFLKSLGLQTESLKAAIENGSFFDVMNEKLKIFGEQASFSAPKFEALVSTYKASMAELQGEATKPLFEGLKNSFAEINEYLSNDTTLKQALANFGEGINEIANGIFNKDTFEAAANAAALLANSIGSLIKAASALSDIAMPDWLAGEKDAGVFSTAAKGLGELAEAFNNIFYIPANLKFDLPSYMLKATQNTNDFRSSLANLGVELEKTGNVWNLGKNENLSTEAAAKGIAAADEALRGLRASLEELKEVKLDKVVEADVKNEIEQQINQIERLKQGLVSMVDAREAANNAIINDNKRVLNEFLKDADARIKSHDRTIATLLAKEQSYNSQLEKMAQQRVGIEEKYARSRESLEFSAAEKIRLANQAGMSEEAKFNDDRLALSRSLSAAKEALNNKDLESFKRYADQAAKINDSLGAQKSLGSGKNAQTINRAADYKNTVNEILALNLSANEMQKNADLAAHDAKMANIAAEKAAVEASLQSEKALYNELIALKQRAAEGKIDFSAEGFEEVKTKIAELKDAMNGGASIKITADDAAAQEAKKSLQAPSSSIHTIDPDAKAAQKTIEALKRPTSSVHTIHVKTIGGGKIKGTNAAAFAAGGAVGLFRRYSGKIAGHDAAGRDDVPALLSRGEFIQNVRAVDYYGAKFFARLNARAIPKEKLARFASGGLVLARQNSEFMQRIDMSISSADVRRLANRLSDKFYSMIDKKLFRNGLDAVRSWNKQYPGFFRIKGNDYFTNFRALAEDLLSRAKQGLNIEGYAAEFIKPNAAAAKNVNLNFNLGGASYKAQTDENTAAALQRYLKGAGV